MKTGMSCQSDADEAALIDVLQDRTTSAGGIAPSTAGGYGEGGSHPFGEPRGR
jgi:hypothetical protein